MIEIILEHFVKSLYEFVYGGAIWRVVYKYLSNVCVWIILISVLHHVVLQCMRLDRKDGERKREIERDRERESWREREGESSSETERNREREKKKDIIETEK